MHKTYWLTAEDEPALLRSVMHELAGRQSVIVLEGSVQATTLRSIATEISVPQMVRREAPDAENVVAIELNPKTVARLWQALMPRERLLRDITAIQIVCDGEIQFMVGDNFHPECVSVGPAFSRTWLDDLVATGILRSYAPANSQGTKDDLGSP